MHRLEVPDPFAGRGIEREQRVGEEVGTQPIAAVKIGRGRAGRDVDEAAGSIHRHARPRVRAARCLVGVGWPGIVSEFARPRNGMEGPADLAGARIVGAYVTGRRTLFFSDSRAPDQYVLVDDSRTGRHQVCIGDVASEAHAEVHGAGIAEGGNRMTGLRIERVQPATGGKEDAPVATISPVHDAAVDM